MTANHEKNGEWVVYLLECSDGSFYTGSTNQLEKRMIRHHRGTASKYTRSRRPGVLHTASGPMGKSDALRLEAKIKKLARSKKAAALAAHDSRASHDFPKKGNND